MGSAKELDLREFEAFLNRTAAEVARLDYRPVLKICSLLIKADVLENFQGSHDPAGNPWKPLKRPRPGKRHKGSTPKPLLDTGLLRASITASGQGHIEEVTADSLTVGTALDYGAFHQEGTKYIPQREFAGFSDKLLDQIEEAVGEFLEKNLF